MVEIKAHEGGEREEVTAKTGDGGRWKVTVLCFGFPGNETIEQKGRRKGMVIVMYNNGAMNFDDW